MMFQSPDEVDEKVDESKELIRSVMTHSQSEVRREECLVVDQAKTLLEAGDQVREERERTEGAETCFSASRDAKLSSSEIIDSVTETLAI